MTDQRLALVGAGFSGLGMAARLRQAGERDFTIYEREPGVGGTWRLNHYPGCACDVESHLYSLSFAPNPDWTRTFAAHDEIRAYLEGVVTRFDLAPHLRLSTAVRRLDWDEQRAHWRLTLDDGAETTARCVVAGMGGLSRPALPDLPGLTTFRGPVFHSQQWDHGLDLRGKRVAVVGTGASAIQFVPRIQPVVGRLDLYQRTPPWVLAKRDRPIRPWLRSLFRALPAAALAYRGALYAWLEAQVVAFTAAPGLMRAARHLALGHLRAQIADPALRARLTPDYAMGCKRILLSNDYYPALAQPNVEVVTTGLRAVHPDGIETQDGCVRPCDVLILGTGFQASDPLPRGVVFGRDGRDLLDTWPQGPEAYKGTLTTGFPNLFFLMGPNTGLGHSSMVYMIESQIAYVMDALRRMEAHGLAAVDVRPEVQAAYNEALQRRAQKAIWSVGGCRSWYLHPVSGRNVTLWPGATFAFRRQTRRFDLESYRTVPREGAP
jgi:cation diffusion facilitator CzcD-associated flavoprotein CzcO